MVCLARVVVCAMVLGGCGRLGYAELSSSAVDGGAGFDGAPGSGFDGGTGAAVCGDGRTQGAELCDDGNRSGGDGCSADCSAREICGDGVVQGGEACDDANAIAGDGCEADCTFSCVGPADCADTNACDGEELCADHACREGTPAADGTPCEGDGRSCRGGACALATCGDGSTDPGEECDDGDLEDGDGCDNGCTFSCTGDCDDGDVCSGDESCIDHVCVPGVRPPPGTPCDRDMNPETRDICLEPGCVRSICSDGWVDEGEECDDGNLDNGDGCDNDCRFSCTSDMECSDSEPCNGIEHCTATTHACESGSPLADGTSCAGGRCVTGRCVAGSADAGAADAGSSDAGGICAPTAPISCFKACRVDADCVLVQGSCCCGCASGGSSESVNAAQVDAWNARMRAMCPRPGDCGACLDVYRCLMGTQCVMDQCRAIEGSAS